MRQLTSVQVSPEIVPSEPALDSDALQPTWPDDQPGSINVHFVLESKQFSRNDRLVYYISITEPVPERSLLCHVTFFSGPMAVRQVTGCRWAFSSTLCRHYTYLPPLSRSQLIALPLPEHEQTDLDAAVFGIAPWRPLASADALSFGPAFIAREAAGSDIVCMRALKPVWTQSRT